MWDVLKVGVGTHEQMSGTNRKWNFNLQKNKMKQNLCMDAKLIKNGCLEGKETLEKNNLPVEL